MGVAPAQERSDADRSEDIPQRSKIAVGAQLSGALRDDDHAQRRAEPSRGAETARWEGKEWDAVLDLGRLCPPGRAGGTADSKQLRERSHTARSPHPRIEVSI